MVRMNISKEAEKMTDIITAIIAAIPSSALPLLVCILGCVLGYAFIYLKIQSQRKVTKEERDNTNEAFDRRLTICEHDIAFMKEQNAVFSSKLDKILEELTAIKVSLAKKVDVK